MCFRIAIGAKRVQEAVHHARLVGCLCYRGFVARLGEGMGATVSSPRPASRAWGRATPMYPSRRPSRVTGSRPGCAGAKPRRRPQMFYRGHPVTLDVGTQPFFRHAVPSWLPHAAYANLLSTQRGDPAPGRARAARIAPVSNVARAGPAAGFRPALPRPVASNCLPVAVLARQSVTRARRIACSQRPRLDAGPSARCCHQECRSGSIGPGLSHSRTAGC